MTTTATWIDLDLTGFAKTLTAKGLHRIFLEPYSNAVDTDATEIAVEFSQAAGRATLTVTDNDPTGFSQLSDAYTMWAPSTRANDPTKRGRFGQGEKELIAVCFLGGAIEIASTTGTVRFDESGRHVTKAATPEGSTLTAWCRCNQAQAAAFERMIRRMIVPATNGHGDPVTVTYNGEKLLRPRDIARWSMSLTTIGVGDEGELKPMERRTDVEVFAVTPGEKAYIYELGVPVVTWPGAFHVNIGQKVPLGRDRNSVAPAYQRKIAAAVLDNAVDELTEVDFRKGWVTDALPKARPDVIRQALHTVYGADAVIADPSNREATKLAHDEGREVIGGRALSPAIREAIRQHDIFKPAGQVIQTGVPSSATGTPPLDPGVWSPAMQAVADYTQAAGLHLLGYEPAVKYADVEIIMHTGHAVAWWGGRTITFNLKHLGARWAEKVGQQELDELLIHEFAHASCDDHLSERFYSTCCRLGAKLRTLPTQVTR